MDNQLGQFMIHEDGSQTVLIHFAVRSVLDLTSPIPKIKVTDQWQIACVPNLEKMAAMAGRDWPWRRSDDWRAVTCPRCMASTSYQMATSGRLPPPDQWIHFGIRENEGLLVSACGQEEGRMTDDARATTCPNCLLTQPLAIFLARLVPVESSIHFLFKELPIDKDWKVACGGKVGGKSDDPRAVTCGLCLSSAPFRKRAEQFKAMGVAR